MEIGLVSAGEVGEEVLGMGLTMAFFQEQGNFEEKIHLLIIRVSGGRTYLNIGINKSIDNLSTPLALDLIL